VKPGESHQHHQQADAALGAPEPREEPRTDEGPAEERQESRPKDLILVVVAREHERGCPWATEERSDDHETAERSSTFRRPRSRGQGRFGRVQRASSFQLARL
jgi:hypothetical protein